MKTSEFDLMGQANRKHWAWFLAILCFELWFAYSLKDNLPSEYLRIFADAIGTIAPVVHNFDRIAPNPESLSYFFAVGVLLIIPKAIFFHIWLNSSRFGVYRHFIISPLTATAPASGNEFMTEPLRDDKAPAEKPRSLLSRIVWSLLILVIGGGLALFAMQFGWEITSPFRREFPAELSDVVRSPPQLWFQWSLKRGVLSALYLAIVFNVLRDYFIFFTRSMKLGRGHHE